MASYISRTRKATPDLTCAFCSKKAQHMHHRIPRSEGGDNSPENLIAVCFYHHMREHAQVDPLTGKSDWQRWGEKGGEITSRNPYNFVRNLRQFKNWSDDKLADYVLVRYGYRVPFMTLAEALS